MDKLKYIFLLAFLIVNKPFVIAQKNSLKENRSLTTSIGESIFMHSNATTFVTGETMYYKLYCLNPADNTISMISKIAYVELIDINKQTIFSHKLYLENGIAQGDFFVPTTLNTGNYKLIAYTNWMLNKSVSAIFQMDISIINPFQVYEKNSSNTGTLIASEKEKRAATPNLDENHSFENKNFSFILNKKVFSTREEIALKIKSLTEIPEKGNYSLSVRRVEDLPTKAQLNSIQYLNTPIETTNISAIKENKIVLPELRGEMITGMILSKKEPKDVQNKTVALSIPGKPYAFKIVKTNQSGKFIFNIDKAYYNSDIIIQVMGDDRENFSIKLDKPHTVDYSMLSFQSNLNLTSDLKNSIQERSVANQIENAYYNKKADSLAKTTLYDSFFEPIAKEYILDDYTRFSSLKETITEVVTEMFFKVKEGKYSINLRNTDFNKEKLEEPALVLVDGLLIQDVDELFEYRTENIYKISVVPGVYYYGPEVFNGIIGFTTKNNDFISKSKGDFIIKAAIQRPLPQKKYYQPDYADRAKYERIPDYRYQLLWMPELTLDNKDNLISFYTSDVSGTFEIQLEGFTEKGIPVSIKEIIEVK